MEDIIATLLELEEKAISLYRDLHSKIVSSTARELIEQVLSSKRFELETLKLLTTGNIPDKFMGFGSISENDVNLRQGPASTEQVISVLESGTPVILTERHGNWMGVKLYDGRAGWVFKDYVKVGL